jgi:hypothetical protein
VVQVNVNMVNEIDYHLGDDLGLRVNHCVDDDHD